ncbi:MAG: viologen exporter family transport system ATP-binding protein [Chthoniobacter sp.]|jgi:ABC-2 type transport system ATP-binding protein|nr:viologen exporter family transport system ATP-binding protein [Chthoniobacter sp.]
MSAIETKGLTKVYRTYKKAPGLWGAVKGLGRREYEEVRAAENVTFSIEEGEFVGFLGPNGAGKTTVLKMLSGLLNPTSGTAKVLGFTPWERKDEMKRQFSLLMGQKNALWWDLPARESLELNRAIYGIEAARFRQIVGGLTELLDVTDKLDVMVRELSLGERMKMELIAALLHTPKVLFLDEPTIGLDVTSQKKVREFLRRYNGDHQIVTMLTSHYMQDIEELCARVIIIDNGRIFFDGPLDSIIDRFATHKILDLTFAAATTCGFADFGEVLAQSPQTVRLKVPRPQVSETCRALLTTCSVTDISVQDLPVEEVIRQLFHEQAEAGVGQGADRSAGG